MPDGGTFGRETASVHVRRPGLCANCCFAATCPAARRTGPPIEWCSMYEAGPDPPPKAKQAPNATRQPGPHGNPLGGLCVDCRRRHTCTFPKPEGGVWSCGQYE